MKKNCLVLAFIFLLANASLAQLHTADNRENAQIIEDVLIRRNRRIPQSVIDSIIKTQKGQEYNLEQLDKDMRALFSTGHFDDVKCFAEDGVQGGKVVYFELVEKPLIYEVIYEGLDSKRQSEIMAELNRQKLEPVKGDEFNAVQCKRITTSIKVFFISKGYQNASVDCLVEYVEQDEVRVSFKIKL